jgi:hypothetical protein
MLRFRLAALAACIAASSVLTTPAGAEPWFGWGENAIEDRYADGDIDEEDHVVLSSFGGGAGSSDARGQSWVSLVGFTRQLLSGQNDVGAMVVVGLALDRIAAGRVHRLADPPRPPSPRPPAPAPAPVPAPAPAPVPVPAPAPAPAPAPQPASPAPPSIALSLAHECVAAALRTSGLGVDDERIDSLIARSRESAWFPEARMRAMRLYTDAAHTTTLATTDGTNTYEALGANLVLELRLTWRFDRLIYAGDEPTLERVRIERQDARARLAAHTLELLFAWQRALLDARAAPASSREALDAELRAAEAAATLDVLTAGWFSHRQDPP